MIKFLLGLILGIVIGGNIYYYVDRQIEQPVKTCNVIAKHPLSGTFEHEVKRTE